MLTPGLNTFLTISPPPRQVCLIVQSHAIGGFPFTKKFGKFPLRILGISVWEESVPFVTSPIRLQAPLRRFTKKPDALVNCYAIFSNASLFVAFPSNKWLLSACVVMRSLTSACSRRSRFTVVETSPVNERTFQSCSCNILVFTRETCIGKESFEQARISTYHFYIRHICAAINGVTAEYPATGKVHF